MADIPVVYTLTVCPACDALRSAWGRQGTTYEERRVDQSQETLDEALEYADTVPIIVYPGGRVEVGFEGQTG
ncbi:MAG: glutaredoxin domain-containing protein [Candidatus Neomarinimicrobiota bacterium]